MILQVTALLMMPVRQKREDCSHELDLHQAWFVSLKIPVHPFMVVEATKRELKKLKFKTPNLLCGTAGLQQGVIPSVWRANSTFISLGNQ